MQPLLWNWASPGSTQSMPSIEFRRAALTLFFGRETIAVGCVSLGTYAVKREEAIPAGYWWLWVIAWSFVELCGQTIRAFGLQPFTASRYGARSCPNHRSSSLGMVLYSRSFPPNRSSAGSWEGWDGKLWKLFICGLVKWGSWHGFGMKIDSSMNRSCKCAFLSAHEKGDGSRNIWKEQFVITFAVQPLGSWVSVSSVILL